jgi:hypothetical protein
MQITEERTDVEYLKRARMIGKALEYVTNLSCCLAWPSRAAY